MSLKSQNYYCSPIVDLHLNTYLNSAKIIVLSEYNSNKLNVNNIDSIMNLLSCEIINLKPFDCIYLIEVKIDTCLNNSLLKDKSNCNVICDKIDVCKSNNYFVIYKDGFPTINQNSFFFLLDKLSGQLFKIYGFKEVELIYFINIHREAYNFLLKNVNPEFKEFDNYFASFFKVLIEKIPHIESMFNCKSTICNEKNNLIYDKELKKKLMKQYGLITE